MINFKNNVVCFLICFIAATFCGCRSLTQCCKEHGPLNAYKESNPVLGSYYISVVPVDVEGLRLIGLLESDFVRRELGVLRELSKKESLEEVRNVIANIVSRREAEIDDLRCNSPEMLEDLESVIRKGDKICLFHFKHPQYSDYGVLVLRDGKLVLREVQGGGVPAELESLGFEVGIFDIYDE